MNKQLARWGVASLSLGAALAVSACGGGDKGPVADPSASKTPSPTPSSVQPSEVPADSTEAGIARFEDYLHALGNGDVDTLCEIAGPAAEAAEESGMGTCEETFPLMLEMISAQEKEALKTATVDPAKVEADTPGQVFIPVEAVQADVEFSDGDLGSYTLVFQEDDWYIIE